MKNTSIHGMSSEKASKTKIAGHKRELERKEFLATKGIESEILGGTIKPDILRKTDGLLESVKGGAKVQWYLFGYESVENSDFFNKEEKDCFNRWASCYEKINPSGQQMCETIKQNPEKWVRFFIGADKFNIIAIKDKRDGNWYEINIDTFIKKLMCQVTEIYYTGTKVVFKGGSGVWVNNPRRKNGVILMELDRRSAIKKSLFHSPLDRIIDCVK
jgi:hypothetical protein